MSARPSLIDPANGPTPHLVSCFAASISTLTSHRSSELLPLFRNLFLPHIPLVSLQLHHRYRPHLLSKSLALYPPQSPRPPSHVTSFPHISSISHPNISSQPLVSPQSPTPVPQIYTPPPLPPPPFHRPPSHLPSPISHTHHPKTSRSSGPPPPSARTHPAFPALEPVIHHPRPGAVARGCTRGARRGRSRHYA